VWQRRQSAKFSPPLIAERSHIDRIFETVSDVIRAKASPR
jgi:4-aminobutyrate aminotransferase-like enzyme